MVRRVVLGLSTSTLRGSVAIVDGGTVLASSHYEDERGHAERLFLELDVALRDVPETSDDHLYPRTWTPDAFNLIAHRLQ